MKVPKTIKKKKRKITSPDKIKGFSVLRFLLDQKPDLCESLVQRCFLLASNSESSEVLDTFFRNYPLKSLPDLVNFLVSTVF
jgi:hypothetical protein